MERFNQSFADGKQEIDIDAKYLPKGRYRLGQNITVATSESSDKGVVQNIRGNRQVPFAFSDPVSIGATTIGHGVDTLNNKIYWFFIGNTTEGVYEFDPVQNMVFRILEVSRYRRILNFNVNNRIT
ncbi:MAG: hypothetical protein MPJ22_11215, partial [Pirellulales bacterium]|nr:hypothetical protein [Pirellulales bacterium]